jgi:diacylglycerol O-acyltransferase
VEVVSMALMPITDAVFLIPERREQPMHVGSLQLFQLPDSAGSDWVRDLYDRLLGSTEIRSLFRRRPVRSLRTLGSWHWALDDDVDLEHHVRHSALPRPGRVRELLALTSRLHGTLLDRQRPLWEMHVIEGLEGNRFAIYTKIHHALMDGVSAMALLRSVLSPDPDAAVPPMWAPRPHEPRRDDGELSDLPAALLRGAGELVGLGPALGRRAAAALLAPRRKGSAVPPRTMLNVPITGSRRYAAQSWSLERVKLVGKACDATVNDVVLAMCSSALRDYLLEFAALPEDPLLAMTPVSLRATQSGTPAGNAVGAIVADLATDVADPAERLRVIQASMRAGKEALAGLSPLQATVLSAMLIAPLGLSASRLLSGIAPQAFNLIISNVPGPTQPLYLDGARLSGLYPLSVPLDGQALNITVTSYNGSLDVGLTGDRRALPHLQRLLGYLGAGLDDLARVAGVP